MTESEHVHHSPTRRDRSLQVRLIASAVLLLFLVLFVAANFVVVEVRFIVWNTNVRLGWALIIAAAVGFIAGFLLPRRKR